MSYGYTVNLINANASADQSSIGVSLGKVCIECGIPVQNVAVALGVTKATVYNWFAGTYRPKEHWHVSIHTLMAYYVAQNKY